LVVEALGGKVSETSSVSCLVPGKLFRTLHVGMKPLGDIKKLYYVSNWQIVYLLFWGKIGRWNCLLCSTLGYSYLRAPGKYVRLFCPKLSGSFNCLINWIGPSLGKRAFT